MIKRTEFAGPRAYLRALGRDPSLAIIQISMAAELLEVKVATVQGYVRAGKLRELVIGADRTWVGVSASDVRAMRAVKLKRLRTIAKIIEPILIAAALAGHIEEYSAALMVPAGLDHALSRDRDLLGKALAVVSKKSWREHRCLLSVLAVGKNTGLPNDAFFELAKHLGALSSTISNGNFFERHKKLVFKTYGALAPGSLGKAKARAA